MKILVLQLARLGDIYMSWPALRALRRTYPSAEIHLLTRPRFEGAVEGLEAIDHHHTLRVSTILSPLVQKEPDCETALERLNASIENLKEKQFDWIVNLTFSPVSSYLTHALSTAQTQVSGYTRYSDGTLCLPDDMSSYFYAQIGSEKPNRVHLADFFAALLKLDYVESDWCAPTLSANEALNLPPRYVVLHVGASEAHKSLSATHWIEVLRTYVSEFSDIPLVLIGSKEERVVADEIQSKIGNHSVYNLAGETHIKDIFHILTQAELLIGCDSAPIHMASLTDTPTFNVSIGRVNFWETGPKASLSFIYRAESLESLGTSHLGSVICQTLRGELNSELWMRAGGLVSYFREELPEKSFSWNLIQALYLGGAFPMAEKIEILQGADRLAQMNDLALSQIALISERGLNSVGPILDRVEEVIESVGKIVPELAPYISWYQAEKVRIGPGDLNTLCEQATRVHQRFLKNLRPYLPHEDTKEENHGKI